MKEFFSSFFSSANIIVRATVKKQWNVRAALTGRVVRKCLIPRAVPWAVESCPFGARCLLINVCINHSKYRMNLFFTPISGCGF